VPDRILLFHRSLLLGSCIPLPGSGGAGSYRPDAGLIAPCSQRYHGSEAPSGRGASHVRSCPKYHLNATMTSNSGSTNGDSTIDPEGWPSRPGRVPPERRSPAHVVRAIDDPTP
jgi:hypothetical protein